MPFDGDLQPNDGGWTITVEPSPSISEQSQFWSTAQRLAYHQITASVAFHVVTAIQNNDLRRRREKLLLPQGDAKIFFRLLRDEYNAIRVTIFEVHFRDSDDDHDPDGGAPAPHPLDPLVLNVSGCGNRFSIDYVEGVLPRPPCTNRINRLQLAYTPFSVQVSERGSIESARYYLVELRGITHSQNSYENWQHAAAKQASSKYASWEIERLFQNDSALSVGCGADPVVASCCRMESFAQDSRKSANTITRTIIATDARYSLSLPSLAFHIHKSSRIYTHQIHPSGSS
jgi:hypothetical protein